MLDSSYSLHHKQHQAHETESIAKILEYDGGSDVRPLSGWKHARNVYTKNGILKQQQSVNDTFRNPLAEI